MGKAKVQEKRVTTTKLSIEGVLKLDNLQGFVVELEEQGDLDIADKIKKYNGSYGTLTWTEKLE